MLVICVIFYRIVMKTLNVLYTECKFSGAMLLSSFQCRAVMSSESCTEICASE